MPSRLVLLSWNDSDPLAPGNALPTPPAYPSHGLPSTPGGPATLPVFPFDPDVPSNALPGAPPVATQPIAPGGRFVIKWIACVGLCLVPDNSLPPTPAPK
jgi:hypothetical protein